MRSQVGSNSFMILRGAVTNNWSSWCWSHRHGRCWRTPLSFNLAPFLEARGRIPFWFIRLCWYLWRQYFIISIFKLQPFPCLPWSCYTFPMPTPSYWIRFRMAPCDPGIPWFLNDSLFDSLASLPLSCFLVHCDLIFLVLVVSLVLSGVSVCVVGVSAVTGDMERRTSSSVCFFGSHVSMSSLSSLISYTHNELRSQLSRTNFEAWSNVINC